MPKECSTNPDSAPSQVQCKINTVLTLLRPIASPGHHCIPSSWLRNIESCRRSNWRYHGTDCTPHETSRLQCNHYLCTYRLGWKSIWYSVEITIAHGTYFCSGHGPPPTTIGGICLGGDRIDLHQPRGSFAVPGNLFRAKSQIWHRSLWRCWWVQRELWWWRLWRACWEKGLEVVNEVRRLLEWRIGRVSWLWKTDREDFFKSYAPSKTDSPLCSIQPSTWFVPYELIVCNSLSKIVTRTVVLAMIWFLTMNWYIHRNTYGGRFHGLHDSIFSPNDRGLRSRK